MARQQIENLHAVLADATPAAAHALRALLAGPIEVQQVERPGKKRYFLRGTLRVSLASVLNGAGLASAATAEAETSPYEEITIEFVRPNPLDASSDQAKALWDQQLSNKEIGRRLGCSPAAVTKLLKHWARRHGVELTDGRKRRWELTPSPENVPGYQQIADQVMELYHQGMEIGDIAVVVGHDRNTITKAIVFWHEQRGLTVVDGRKRRKSLHKSNKAQLDQPDASPDRPAT